MSRYLSTTLTFLKVDLEVIPEKELRILSTAVLRDWAKYPDYFACAPNIRELAVFITRAKDRLTKLVNANVTFEESGVQRGIAPQWNGLTCTIGESSLNYDGVPHDPSHSLRPANQRIAVQASMLLRNSEEGVVGSLSPSVMKDSPLNAFHSEKAYSDYVFSMGGYLSDKKVQGNKPEPFAKSVYGTIAKESPSEQAALRQIMYNSYDKAKIHYDQKSATFYVHPDFDVSFDGVSKMPDGRAVPAITFKKFLGKVNLTTQGSLEKEKDPVMVLLSFINSRMPGPLIKYYGYRGFPGKNQRQFFEIRPFLAGCILVDPPVMLRRWCTANGLAKKLKTAGNLAVVSDVDETDIPLFQADYSDKMETKRDAVFFGAIKFSAAFWKNFDVLMYRPTVDGKFFFTQKSNIRLSLPDTYCKWKFQRITGSALMIKALGAHVSTLMGCYYAATYAPREGLYDGLRYPIDEVVYNQINVNEVTDIDRQQASAATKAVLSSFSVTAINYDDVDTVPSVVSATTASAPSPTGVTRPAPFVRFYDSCSISTLEALENEGVPFCEGIIENRHLIGNILICPAEKGNVTGVDGMGNWQYFFVDKEQQTLHITVSMFQRGNDLMTAFLSPGDTVRFTEKATYPEEENEHGASGIDVSPVDYDSL